MRKFLVGSLLAAADGTYGSNMTDTMEGISSLSNSLNTVTSQLQTASTLAAHYSSGGGGAG